MKRKKSDFVDAVLGIHVLPRSQRNTDIPLLFNRLIAVYFQLPLQWEIVVFIKHHMGKKTINAWCPASIALKNGFSLRPGKHKNASLAKLHNGGPQLFT